MQEAADILNDLGLQQKMKCLETKGLIPGSTVDRIGLTSKGKAYPKDTNGQATVPRIRHGLAG